jgi:hypothetical protein
LATDSPPRGNTDRALELDPIKGWNILASPQDVAARHAGRDFAVWTPRRECR